MNIGAASKASGVSAKMIRYYEATGVMPPSRRSEAGYRRYGSRDVEILKFIRHARDVGFGTADIIKLLSLWRDERPSREVRALALGHLEQIRVRIEELNQIAAALTHLIEHCHGDDRPDCPILASLRGQADGAGRTD